jgi:putative hydrolase of the HAD superfamily
MAERAHPADWVFLFDLDNTLYPRRSGLLSRLDQRINEYLIDRKVVGEAHVDELRRRYVREYGTTLRGCQVELGIDPVDYITHTHDIDARLYLRPDAEVSRTLEMLPGTKVLFSNSPRVHVDSVLGALGLSGAFERMYTIESFGYVGKPCRVSYERVVADLGAEAQRCVMVEDSLVNLVVPHEMGMVTVLVSDDDVARPDYVDYVVCSLPELMQLPVFRIAS